MTTPLSLSRGQPVPDNDALRIATLLHHAAMATDDARSQERLLRIVTAAARKYLTPEARAAGCIFDRKPARSTIDLLRLVSEHQEVRGNVLLAASIIESLAALRGVDAMSAGRLLADRARLARRQMKLDLAVAQLTELLRRGRRMKSVELQARALQGMIALAQLRGNYPEMDRLGARVYESARRAGLTRMMASTLLARAIAASISGDASTALVLAWEAYRLGGADPRIGGDVLTNLAQILYDSGRPTEARAAAITALNLDSDARFVPPALGAYALASAQLGDRGAVDWAAKQAVAFARLRVVFVREAAVLLHDCAIAYATLGLENQSGVMRRRAHAIAVEHGFHDVVFKMEYPLTTPTAFAPAAESAVNGVRKLEKPLRVATLWTKRDAAKRAAR